jgi:hypothetical protein
LLQYKKGLKENGTGKRLSFSFQYN